MLAASNVIPIVAIVAVLVIGIAGVVFKVSRDKSSGTLSRETKQRDKAATKAAANDPSTDLVAVGAAQEDPRARAEGVVEAARRGTVAEREPGEISPWVPIDEEEVGLSRRQFFNRGLIGFIAIGGLLPFGATALAFLWPTGSGGFGGKVVAGRTDDIKDQITSKKAPFYVPAAKAYIQTYPAAALPKAKAVYKPIVYQAMAAGFTCLYQRCVHLGCRVPWCESSQWFECPCHGSKYSAVGEKKAGPAPRGLDHFVLTVGSTMTIDTGTIVSGVPIGTDTTGQQAEGPHCV